MTPRENDERIVALIADGTIRVDAARGRIYSAKSRRPRRAMRGTLNHKGYRRICVRVQTPAGVRKLFFLAHRVVWVSVHGPLPDGWEIDHRHRRKTDNRIAELQAMPGELNNAKGKADIAAERARKRHATCV